MQPAAFIQVRNELIGGTLFLATLRSSPSWENSLVLLNMAEFFDEQLIQGCKRPVWLVELCGFLPAPQWLVGQMDLDSSCEHTLHQLIPLSSPSAGGLPKELAIHKSILLGNLTWNTNPACGRLNRCQSAALEAWSRQRVLHIFAVSRGLYSSHPVLRNTSPRFSASSLAFKAGSPNYAAPFWSSLQLSSKQITFLLFE